VNNASSILAIQGIENAYSVLGKTITLSFWARASASTKIVSEQQIHSITAPLWTPTICKTFDLTTTWQKFTHTYTLPTYSQVIAAGYNPNAVDVSLTNPTYTPVGEAATLPLVDWLFQVDIKTAWCLGEWRRHGNAYSGSRPSGFEGTQQTLTEMQNMNNSFITNGYYDIAQVQLELGSVATPFELRPISTEFNLCQRYYEKSYNIYTPPGTITGTGNFVVRCSSNNQVGTILFKQSKRVNPSITFYNPSTGNPGTWRDVSSGIDIIMSVPIGSLGHSSFAFDATSSVNGNQLQGHWTASAEI